MTKIKETITTETKEITETIKKPIEEKAEKLKRMYDPNRKGKKYFMGKRRK